MFWFRRARQIARRIRNHGVLRRMHGIIAQRPISLAVQTCDACNASCVFCARRKIKATGATMPSELFRKLCHDYAALGGGHLGFSPLLADPLIDPLFMERIAFLAERHPTITPDVFTNGIALSNFSDAELTMLLDSVHHIDISIGGLDRESYRIMYGVDRFEVVWAQLKRLSRLNRRQKALKIHLRTNRKSMQLSSPRLVELTEMGYLCNDITDSFSDWSGLVTGDDLPRGANLATVDNSHQSVPCFAPMFNMMVLQDGTVLACGCMDANRRFAIGDLKEQTVAELWRSPALSELRRSFERQTMPEICRSCAYYRPYRDYYCNPGLRHYRPEDDFWSSLV